MSRKITGTIVPYTGINSVLHVPSMTECVV